MLRRGARGPEVARLQGLLGQVADGEFGPVTEAAVRDWQRARGLTADGLVGPKTWAALEAEAAPPVPKAGGVEITAAQIREGFPRCADPSAWAAAFSSASERFPAFNRTGWACILAKANTEAGGLTRWDENLFYTSAEQVKRMFGGRAGANPEKLLRNPRLLGDTVYSHLGGYDGRGLGVIQLTGLANHSAFAMDMGKSLTEARAYMQTIPGAAMTAPWYLDHYGATAKANAGDMKAVLAVVAGKTVDGLSTIWTAIHGDQQMADFERFRKLLGRTLA
ncbi:peptidoglycan-binding domain-containing protein [Roseococcus sp. YIM B11640]|uniref:peptidoglycan-binding domain-containing protein n=1 Tax=Roseococcus sp. YIM B11640 TaxID=3133973 RepID=UPI003C7EC9FC